MLAFLEDQSDHGGVNSKSNEVDRGGWPAMSLWLDLGIRVFFMPDLELGVGPQLEVGREAGWS
jgi:hypothetical protein